MALAVFAVPAQARHVPDEVMVRFRPGAAAADMRRAVDEVGGRQAGELPGMRVLLVKLPPGLPVETAIARMEKNPNVDVAEPNLVIHAASLPTDSYFPLQWSLDRISASRCWAENVAGAAGSASVTIAIVDSGISSGHPDLAGKLVSGYNAINPASPPEDDNGHGTGVAAVAAAAANGVGVVGVAQNAKLMPVKVLDSDGGGSEFTSLSGVLWAAEHGARVINMSYGSCDDRTRTCPPGDAIGADTMRQAWALGAILVAATGNDGSSGVSYPAGYPHVIGVGATGPDDQRAWYSNWGPAMDVVAPGGAGSEFYCDYASDILTASIPPVSSCPGSPSTNMDPRCACTYPPLSTSVYVAEAGTSFATPIVSGLAAVLVGVDPARTADQVTSLIEQTADQPRGGRGWNESFGYGRVNMYRALTNAVTLPPADTKSLAWTYPNPFCPAINGYATFVVPGGRGQPVTVEIRDTLGNLVWSKSLSAAETAGLDLYYNSPIRWDGRDSRGRDLANGVYNARIVVGPKSCLKRVVIAR